MAIRIVWSNLHFHLDIFHSYFLMWMLRWGREVLHFKLIWICALADADEEFLFRSLSLARSLSHSQWSLLIHLLSAIMVKAWPNVIVWRPKMKYWPNDENKWQPIRCYFKWQMVLWEIFPFFPLALTLWMDAMAVWLDVGANSLYTSFLNCRPFLFLLLKWE